MLAPLVGGIIWLVLQVLHLYWWVLILSIVSSWLVAFDVINTRHPMARAVINFLYAATEPVLRPLRRYIPPMGGIDLSPIAAFLLLGFVEYLLLSYQPLILSVIP